MIDLSVIFLKTLKEVVYERLEINGLGVGQCFRQVDALFLLLLNSFQFWIISCANELYEFKHVNARVPLVASKVQTILDELVWIILKHIHVFLGKHEYRHNSTMKYSVDERL